MFSARPTWLPDPLAITVVDPLAFTALTPLLRQYGLVRIESAIFCGAGEDTLTRLRQVLGKQHPDTLHSAHDLAAALTNLDEHDQTHRLGRLT